MNKPSEESEFVAAPTSKEEALQSKPPRARVSDAVDPQEEAPVERKRDYL